MGLYFLRNVTVKIQSSYETVMSALADMSVYYKKRGRYDEKSN